MLFAFGRLVYRLDEKNFWWDESLSLQRSEANLGSLLRGDLVISDGVTAIPTIDQHPFFSFLLQGVAIRLAGDSEFVLRFPSAAAATLLLPAIAAFAALLEKKKVLPTSSVFWASLLVAINPFFLWYGQEARPYALWAFLTVVCTYLLLRASFQAKISRRLVVAYAITLLMLLATHYLALYVIPIHAVLIFTWLVRRNLRTALLSTLLLSALGVVGGFYAIRMVGGGVGANFPATIGLAVMIPDLLNAFSMGLSVNINDVWWIDLMCGGLLLIGVAWSLRSRASLRNGGWLLPLLLITPVIMLQLSMRFSPINTPYMNARHMSLIGGPFLLLLGGGLAAIWQRQKIIAALLALVIIAASVYSSNKYFFEPFYDKEKYAELGTYLHDRLLPGDIVLLDPPHARRIYQYYLPLHIMEQAKQAGAQVDYAGVPQFGDFPASSDRLLEQAQTHYKRIWLVISGTPAEGDPSQYIDKWLHKHNFRLQFVRFHAYQSILDLYLFLPYPPVLGDPRINEPIDHPTAIVFDKQIRLAGYSFAPPLRNDMARPITLFWQTLDSEAENYKYILQWVETKTNGESVMLTATEEEPYETLVPTSIWRPEQTLIEYTELPPTTLPLSVDATYELRLQLYRVSTSEKVAVTDRRYAKPCR